MLIGLGATAMEVIDCALAFTSFAAFLQNGWVQSNVRLRSAPPDRGPSGSPSRSGAGPRQEAGWD